VTGAGPIESDLAAVAALDRLQGSAGLARAADLVAERAEAAGLVVDLRWYRPAPDRRWWTFAMPLAASPVRASLAIHPDGGEPVPLVGYPETPMCLARGSASHPAATVELTVDGDPRGRLVLVPATAPPPSPAGLEAAGAIGFARESGAGDPDTVDRMEVPDGCRLLAFSLSKNHCGRLRDALARGDRVRVEAVHDPPAPMPLVCAVNRAPAPTAPYALLAAHLCHPAPGANDNASGVAALLAFARAVGADAPLWGVQLLWAPEIVGAAAFVHDVLPNRPRRPEFALSVDMVGRPDAALVIEAPPDHLASPLPAALDIAADAVSPPGRSYSGAVAVPTWPRLHTPFVGAGDHLVFADRPAAVVAAALGGWPDPYRHTSRDGLAEVSAGHVARVAEVLRLAVRWLLAGERLDAIADRAFDLAAARLAEAARRAHLAAPPRADLLSPYDKARAGGTVRAVGAAGDTALARLAGRYPSVAARCDRHRRALGTMVTAHAGALLPGLPAAPVGRALVRTWSGPWNLRAFRDGLPARARERLDAYRDAYPWMTAVALAVDGRRDYVGVLAAAAASAQIDLPMPAAAEFLETLIASGWVSRAPAAGPRRAPPPRSGPPQAGAAPRRPGGPTSAR